MKYCSQGSICHPEQTFSRGIFDMYRLFFKQCFDYFFSFVTLFVFLPLFIVLYGFGYFFIGSPVFFTQERPGLNGKPFKIFKFRTMLIDDGSGLQDDNLRMTSYGRFLRRSSLDEIPEIFNILRGDMSIVGPRPLLMEYLDMYTDEQFKRHNVKPGITGLAQINGRNNLTWDEKFNYDLLYVDKYSFFLDAKIIIRTLFVVLSEKNVAKDGHATTEYFVGKNK